VYVQVTEMFVTSAEQSSAVQTPEHETSDVLAAYGTQ